LATENVRAEMDKVASLPQMSERDEVKRFWQESTRDFLEDRRTGIDISHRQDGYWRALDMWEKQLAFKHSPDALILDLGCGTGRISDYLSARGREVLSVDYITDAVAVIKRTRREAKCASMNSVSLGLRSGCVDGVVSCRVLQSLATVAEKELALREIARVLKPGGRLVMTEGNPLRTRFVPVPYNYYLPLAQWKELLVRHGFVVERVYGIPFLTVSKAFDRLSRGLLARFTLPFRLASLMDGILGFCIPTALSLQFDLVARRV